MPIYDTIHKFIGDAMFGWRARQTDEFIGPQPIQSIEAAQPKPQVGANMRLILEVELLFFIYSG